MSTKSFKDICVEYAHQLGKGLPLTPAEMCNAVIMYLNAQITEMQGITTALQTAVSEAESSATEATNTANELSGKVDTLQTSVDNLSRDFDDLSDNVPLLSGRNVFKGDNSFSTLDSGIVTVKNRFNLDSGIIHIYGSQYTAQFPNESGTIVYTSRLSGYAQLSGKNNDWTGSNTFRGGLYCVIGDNSYKDNSIIHDTIINNVRYKSYGSIAGTDNICISGKDILIYAQNKPRYKSTNSNKIVELLTSEDIPVVTPKYFTRVICNDANTNTLYIFSCITEEDLSGNNVYGDVVSLLTELGAINPTSALPCSGKTSAGGEVIGVYTDGSAITVFSGDNATEDIPTSAEINIISK